MKPAFVCAGFAKCGTTTLHEILKQHPDIYLPVIKEPIYYNDPKALQKGFSWYCSRYYPKRTQKKIVGEINMAFTMKNVAARVYKEFGENMKLIFIMRNPVDRLYSEYRYATRLEISSEVNARILQKETNSQRFDKMLSRHLKMDAENQVKIISGSYGEAIRGGNYFHCINEYLKYYPIENMKFIFFEDFIKNKKKTCEEIFDFLGVRRTEHINYDIWVNEGNRIGKNDRDVKIYRFISDYLWRYYLLSMPLISESVTKHMLSLYNKFFLLLTKEDQDKSKISPNARKKLEFYYSKDKELLEQLLNIDLSSLWFK